MVFLDTAGRLHIDEALMDELKRIKAAVQPNEILLVVDAMTGQDAVNAATAFDEALGIDGVMLTKLDGDARGGAALSDPGRHRQAHQVHGHGRKARHDRALPPRPHGVPHPGHGRRALVHRKAPSRASTRKRRRSSKKSSKRTASPSPIITTSSSSSRAWASVEQLAGMMPGQLGKQMARRRA